MMPLGGMGGGTGPLYPNPKNAPRNTTPVTVQPGARTIFMVNGPAGRLIGPLGPQVVWIVNPMIGTDVLLVRAYVVCAFASVATPTTAKMIAQRSPVKNFILSP